MKPEYVIKSAALFLALFGIASATIKTTQEPALKKEIISAVRDSLVKDSIAATDTIFIESGLVMSPRLTDSAKAEYLSQIGYFDTLRIGECSIVLIPKSINKLVTEKLNATRDSLLTANVIKKLVK